MIGFGKNLKIPIACHGDEDNVFSIKYMKFIFLVGCCNVISLKTLN